MIVVCIKVGNKYPAEYVNRLESMVRRHTTRDFRFLCLTDDPVGVKCETADIETHLPGWWAKLVLFKPHSVLTERFVYLDLDTVIVGNIDKLFQYTGSFCILWDFWAPSYNSSVMAMLPGKKKRAVWDAFSPVVACSLHGDQDWITQRVSDADVWQNIAPGLIGSYKADHLAAGPQDFSLICFHGQPKPHEFQKGWVYANWI